MSGEHISRETAIANIVAMTEFRTAPELNSYVEKAAYRMNGWIGGLRDALIEIGDIPAADVVEVRHGRWKSRQKWNYYVCSECSFENKIAFPYCPNCGARMDGGR